MHSSTARRDIAALLAAALLLGGCNRAGTAAPGAGPAPRFEPGVPLPLKFAPRPTAARITSADLMTRLYIYADDSMGGRDAGTEGAVKATEYLAREVKRMGLQPGGEDGGYFQTLPLKVKAVNTTSTLSIGGAALELRKEWGFQTQGTFAVTDAPVVFGGFLGDTAVKLSADQVRGKLVAYSLPLSNEGITRALFGTGFTPVGAAGVVFLVPQPALGVLNYILQNGVFVAKDGPEGEAKLYVMMGAAGKLFSEPLAKLTPGTAGAATVTVKAITDVTPSKWPARNVVAILPGSDPVLRHQYVAVGAHSDHVGTARRALAHDSIKVFNGLVRPGGAEDEDKEGSKAQLDSVNAALKVLRMANASRPDSIFNGADDDGSGTVSVLEIAEALSAMKVKPKRSILFVWHIGEEKGLWGSNWYTDHPTVPRDSIIAQLNLDMVGRGEAGAETGKTKDGKPLQGGPDYLQLVGSRRLSTELGDLVEAVNRKQRRPMAFDYAMDADGHPMNIYCRSDHYEYARWNIPVTFFTTGGHSDYHQLTDEPQYIQYPHMARVAQLVADVAVELGNRASRPKVDGPRMDPKGSCKQ